MNTIISFMMFIPLLSIILLAVNALFAPSNPYKEKKTPFECGYHSFIEQTRMPFTISFIIFTYMFLGLDIELLTTFPFTVSSYMNGPPALPGALVFIGILTLGLIYELGRGALRIDSKQDSKKASSPVTKFADHDYVTTNLQSNGMYTKSKIISHIILMIATWMILFPPKVCMFHFNNQLGLEFLNPIVAGIVFCICYCFNRHLSEKQITAVHLIIYFVVGIVIYIYGPIILSTLGLDCFLASILTGLCNFIGQLNVELNPVEIVKNIRSGELTTANVYATMGAPSENNYKLDLSIKDTSMTFSSQGSNNESDSYSSAFMTEQEREHTSWTTSVQPDYSALVVGQPSSAEIKKAFAEQAAVAKKAPVVETPVVETPVVEEASSVERNSADEAFYNKYTMTVKKLYPDGISRQQINDMKSTFEEIKQGLICTKEKRKMPHASTTWEAHKSYMEPRQHIDGFNKSSSTIRDMNYFYKGANGYKRPDRLMPIHNYFTSEFASLEQKKSYFPKKNLGACYFSDETMPLQDQFVKECEKNVKE